MVVTSPFAVSLDLHTWLPVAAMVSHGCALGEQARPHRGDGHCQSGIDVTVILH